jgi:hypothetical protein
MSADRDFVTVFRTDGDRANKLFRRKPDGSIEKLAAVEGGVYVAQTFHVPTPDSMADLLRHIGGDPRMCLSLGYFPDAGPGHFCVWPRKMIARAIGLNPKAMSPEELKAKTRGFFEINGQRVVSRTQNNMVQGSWLLGDRDLTPDIPGDLADLDFAGWDDAMALIFPTWDRAGLVMVPSSSGRILVDGRPYGSKPAWHAFVQVSDPDDMRSRVWAQALVKAFSLDAPGTTTPLGYMRNKYSRTNPGEIVGRQPWAIYDPSTCFPERLVFDGAPAVEGKGMAIAEPDVRLVRQGGRIDSRAFEDLDLEQQKSARRVGVRTEKKRDRNGVSVSFVTAATVDLDLELDTEAGTRTVRQLWLENAGHVRCQSPFRDSTSMAAYFNQHSDGVPFVFDTGTNGKYLLTPTCAAGPEPADFLEALKSWLAASGGKVEGPEQIKAASERVRNVIRAAVRHGWEQSAVDVLTEQLAGIMHKPFGVTKAKMAASFRKDAKAAARAAPMGGEGLTDSEATLAEMNERYAVVSIGGSTRVVEIDVYDPCLERRYIRVMGKSDFDLLLMNETVTVMTDRGPREVPKSSWWLAHPNRRTHKGGITLDATGTLGPEYLNTWRGFAVEPVAGDPQIFLDHIRMATAGNGEGAYEYLVGWLATKLQNPGEQMEVAVIFRGDEGTGKGAIGQTMRRIFGGHGMHISQGEHLVGKFNAHLMDCCFLFADEAFFAGDPRHINVLKALITEQTVAIEKKFVDAFQGRNRLGIMMASNADYVVPAGKDARRFFCVDVPDTRKGDREYFKRYFDAAKDPARLGAFLHYLLNYDLSGFEVRDFPQTEMLADQKIATLNQDEKWLLNRLYEGRIRTKAEIENFEDPAPGDQHVRWKWDTWVATATLFEDYAAELRYHGRPQFMLDQARFGQFLARYFKGVRGPRPARVPGYQIGELDEAREQFALYHGLNDYGWGTYAEWDDGQLQPAPSTLCTQCGAPFPTAEIGIFRPDLCTTCRERERILS